MRRFHLPYELQSTHSLAELIATNERRASSVPRRERVLGKRTNSSNGRSQRRVLSAVCAAGRCSSGGCYRLHCPCRCHEEQS